MDEGVAEVFELWEGEGVEVVGGVEVGADGGDVGGIEWEVFDGVEGVFAVAVADVYAVAEGGGCAEVVVEVAVAELGHGVGATGFGVKGVASGVVASRPALGFADGSPGAPVEGCLATGEHGLYRWRRMEWALWWRRRSAQRRRWRRRSLAFPRG